jgi:hypothetical protein
LQYIPVYPFGLIYEIEDVVGVCVVEIDGWFVACKTMDDFNSICNEYDVRKLWDRVYVAKKRK